MNCPVCSKAMEEMALDGHQGTAVEIDACTQCRVFWFDKFESLKLSPSSTLHLMKLIGDKPLGSGATPEGTRCPRCADVLKLTQDMQRNTRFSYWRCNNGHGRLIRFFEFLREKDFIRPLSPQQIEELRQQIQIVNCANCGAPIDLAKGGVCTHCKSPVFLMDMKWPQQLLEQLRRESEPKTIDADLPLKLARAKREIESLFSERDPDRD